MIRREVIALELAPRDRKYKSHTFYECPTCGWLRWSCSAGEDEDVSCPELSFLPIDEWEYQNGRGCERCLAVFARAPELAHWVVEVVGKIRRDLRDGCKGQGNMNKMNKSAYVRTLGEEALGRLNDDLQYLIDLSTRPGKVYVELRGLGGVELLIYQETFGVTQSVCVEEAALPRFIEALRPVLERGGYTLTKAKKR